ncbi:hypothetical protein SSX86_016301 [Deinandra increscens subsp. villosa]|uniref:Homeobox domain-containing protein n=1 Tax=Deinandra increscens subsp. villosa TaxID=3103831 RepID=A0AAP0GVI8_9ASTR
MEFDNVCGTGIVLGLGLNSSPSMAKLNTIGSTKQPYMSLDHSDHKGVTEPSLTLGLSVNRGEQMNYNKIRPVSGGLGGHHGILYQQDNNSTAISGGGSSFSNMSVKREREVGSEESERVSNDNNYSRVMSATSVGSEESERVSNDNNYSRVMSATSVDDVEDDDDCVNGRKKLRLTKPQSALLEEAFKHHSSLNHQKQKQELARKLKLRPRQVEVWFQNRRARTKLKQTEMNFEHLKKCCERLTDENRKLQKELQELKALKSSPSFYMQLPAATLTMCPSCERIGDTKPALAKDAFTMAAKPNYFSSFTNPSAAC